MHLLVNRLLSSVPGSRVLRLCLGICIFQGISMPVSAGEFSDALQTSSYAVATADINGDGVPDVLMRAQPKVMTLPLDDDLMVPIVKPVKSPTFVLLSDGGWFSLVSNPDDGLVRNPLWRGDSHELVFGDVMGDGGGSVLIRAKSSGYPSFVVARDGSGGALRLVQELSSGALGLDVSAQGTTVELKDSNGDGRSDLYVNVDGRPRAVLLADKSGTFHANQDDTIRAVWSAMLAALDMRDPARALTYIGEDSRPKYAQAFTEMGDGVTQVSLSLREFATVEVRSRYATASVLQTVNNRVSIRYITFLRNGNDWTILEF